MPSGFPLHCQNRTMQQCTRSGEGSGFPDCTKPNPRRVQNSFGLHFFVLGNCFCCEWVLVPLDKWIGSVCSTRLFFQNHKAKDTTMPPCARQWRLVDLLPQGEHWMIVLILSDRSKIPVSFGSDGLPPWPNGPIRHQILVGLFHWKVLAFGCVRVVASRGSCRPWQFQSCSQWNELEQGLVCSSPTVNPSLVIPAMHVSWNLPRFRTLVEDRWVWCQTTLGRLPCW